MFAYYKIATEVKPLGWGLQEGSSLAVEAIPLVEVPLRTPIKKSRTATVAADIQGLGVLRLLYLRQVELDLHIVPAGVRVVLVTDHLVFKEKLFGS
jgi:hypothetical protein